MRWWMRIGAFVAALAAAPAASADTIDVNGTMRSYTVQLPAKKPAPLVIVLHGKTQRGADMIARTAWPQVAKREGLAVVFPDGLNHAWADARTKAGPELRGPPAGTDDVAFIAKLVEKLVADGTADARRVYVAGVSNGGAMVMTLVCARADLFVAGASVIMNLTDETAVTCHPSRPLPMLIMNGTADPLIPYEGGRGSSYFAADGFWSTEKTVAFWRELNGCETDDASVTDLPDKSPADQSRSRGSPHAALQGTTSCFIASTGAAIACPDLRRMPASRRSQPACSGRRTAISTAPRRFGLSSASFVERAHALLAAHALAGWHSARCCARQGRHSHQEIP